ncbi:MAG: polysaccharide deacetylase family protein [Chitinispirillia bacterium]|nr:polysaccharide deacetylase family protein [Chitinispirillia bacterium]
MNNSTAGLLLHSVDEKPRLSMSSYSKERFRAFLDYLENNNIESVTVGQHNSCQFSVVGFQQNKELNNVENGDRHKKIAITFDDGLQSFYDNAFPLLEEKNIKSTIFPVAGLVGKTGGWDVMGRTSHMSAAMLREIAMKGHEIGSHSLTHANLVWLGDDDLKKELCGSKAILEDITGIPVRSISFPFGSWNKRVWEMAKSVGYEYAAAYRGHRRVSPEILPVLGVYRFDSVSDIVDRMSPSPSLSKILARIMSHFSKGSPLVKFRKEYVRFPW